MSRVLVITCPSGKQAAQLISQLYNDRSDSESKFTLRLAAHSEASVAKLASSYPDAEIHQTDLSSLAACIELLKGATAVYHVGPSFHSREKEMGLNMIDAAVTESRRPGNKFEHFVFSSVLGTQHRALMQHDLKSYVEERLMISPINWTILQPTNFMALYPATLLAQQEKPVMERLWNPATANSLIDLKDLAEAAVKVLEEGHLHYFAQYPLCSTLPISDEDVGKIISQKISKEVTVKSPTFEEAVTRTLTYLYGVDELPTTHELMGPADGKGNKGAVGELRRDITRDEASRLVLFYNHRGLVGSPNVLRWLLGREPTTVESWVESELRDAGLG
ncbi:hypothetical protein Q7P37_005916 [Cladosporium fusiforme]